MKVVEVVPCYHCADRYIGCHSECDKYNEWKENRKVDKYIQNKYRENMINDYLKRKKERLTHK